MIDPIVPAATKLAAKRAFIRTTLQGLEGLLIGNISATTVIALIRGEIDWLVLAVTAAVTLIAPLIAGVRAWVSITRKGIPADYEAATLAKHSVLTPVEQQTDVQHALEVVEQSR